MNVMVMLLLACLGSPTWGLPLNLHKVAQIDQIISSMKARGSQPGKTERRNQVTESEPTEFIPATVESIEEPVDSEPPVAELDFEHVEIKNLIAFTEFRLDEINALIVECVDSMFSNDPFIDGAYVRDECAGTRFQILYANYHDALKRIKTTLLELMRIKLQQLDDLYYDEVIYFIDLVESLVDGDYLVGKTLEVAKRSSKYYSSPRLFESVVGIAKDEIDAFDQIHQNLANKRRKIQMEIEAKIVKKEQRIRVKTPKHSDLVDKKFEDWKWEEDDILPVEEDEETEGESEEEEEEHVEQEEPESDHYEEHAEEDSQHEAAQEQQSEEALIAQEAEEEAPQPHKAESPDAYDEPEYSSRPAKSRPAENPIKGVGNAITNGVAGTVGFATNTVGKVLKSPAVSSFFETLVSAVESQVKENKAGAKAPEAEVESERRRNKV